MSLFDGLRKNVIAIRQSDGKVFGDIRATVTPDMIIFGHQPDLILGIDDLIEVKLSNGATDIYEVLDPNFREGLSAISPHYQARVKKLGVKEARTRVQNLTINVSGPNARVNSNSTDNSINVASGHQEIDGLLASLREAICGMNISSPEQSDALEVVRGIERHVKADKPSKAVLRALLKSLPTAANVSSVVSAIFGLLAL